MIDILETHVTSLKLARGACSAAHWFAGKPLRRRKGGGVNGKE